ncbi:protein naked cuticle homolog 2 [Salminus brasiliensis]|uniref:protein naked cuticle homolog 2 n=1 Tax=Salminus brasiliensis TaxID=930266 RepID=UPI003B833A72
MGTLQSKHACKRRESPEGGTFATSPLTFHRESDPVRDKQNMCGADLKGDQFLDPDCPLEVILPPERAAEHQSHKLTPENGDVLRKTAKSDDVECNMPSMDENRQEWVFTLYDFDNSGRVTKEDMSSLMHTIYEVVEASVKQSALSNSKTLRVKLTVTPSSSGNRRDRDAGLFLNKREQMEETHSPHIRGQGSSDPVVSSEKKLYRVDENTERRNHYLDLAGIENYTSRFEADNAIQSPVEEQNQDSLNHGVRSAHHRRPQPDSSSPGKSSGRGISFLKSLRSRSKSMGASGGTGKPSRLHGHHPVSWCSPPQQQQQQPPQQQPQPQQYSHSKRVRARQREVLSPSVAHPNLDWDLQPGSGATPAGFVPVAQRHEHHHLHEHHHHHHHHHYYSS